MESRVADSIRRGLEEAIAYVEGTADPSLYHVHTPEKIESQGLAEGIESGLIIPPHRRGVATDSGAFQNAPSRPRLTRR